MKGAGQPAFFSVQIEGARRFYCDPASARRLAIAVLCGGCEQCTTQYEIHRSSFPYRGLEFVVQGSGRLILNGMEYPLAAGTVFVYGPGIPHDITTDTRTPLVKYFVDFSGASAARVLREAGIKSGCVFQTSAPGEVLGVFDDLIRAGLRDTPYSPRILSILLELLIQRLAETRIPFGSAGTPAFETYRRCRQVMDERLGNVSTLEQVAAACHVDAAYVCRLFRRFDQVSPYQYLLRRRMNDAARQLQLDGASVKLVAENLGFSDPFHFSRLFKKVMGVSPSHFTGMKSRVWTR